MPDRAAQMREILAGLLEGKGRLGAAVITRDGLPVVSIMTRPVSEDSFSAMTAAFLGAAESALQEWSDDRPQTAIIEGRQLRLMVAGLDGDFVLALVTPTGGAAPAADLERAAIQMRAFLQPQTVKR